MGAELILANHRRGGDAVIVASAIGRSATQVAARPGITSRDVLRGARWGVINRHDADEAVIRMAFERWGWDIEKDATIVAVGGGRGRLDALLDPDKVDAAIMHAPETFQAPRHGWSIVEDLGRHDVAFQNSCAAVTRQTLTQRSEFVDRYVRAYCRAVWRFRTDSTFGLHVLSEYAGEPDKGVLRDTWVLFARLMGGMMFPSVEGVRNAGEMLFRMGALTERIDPYRYLSLDPVGRFEADGGFATTMMR